MLQFGYIARGCLDKSSAYGYEKVSHIAMYFNFDRKSTSPSRTLPFSTLCSEGISHKYENLFKNASNSFLTHSLGSITTCNGVIMQIIGCLYDEHKNSDIHFKKLRKIESSVGYLKAHYDSADFKTSKLSQICGMSEKNFRRIFCGIYNKMPYAFLLEFRINKAEILILNTTKSISDIAIQCGFSDVYSFSHSFKRHFGISPAKYRAENI